jgi:hypothetical protein
MVRASAILGALLTASVLASASSAAPPKKWYWTEARAETLVQEKVGIPDCWFSGDSRCDNPPGPYWASGGPRWKPASADCTGADEAGTSFKFGRFACKIVIADYYGKPLARGIVAVYPTGASTMRWKLIG